MQKRLTIGTPCHADWEKMTPNQEGRFCQSCEKTVVDLTGMTQPQMVALFEEKQGDMCGRMNIEKPRSARPAVRGLQPVLSGRFRKFAIALLAALGFISLSTDMLHAQGRKLQGAVAYHATADASAYVEVGGYPASGAQVQLKQDRVVIAERITDTEGNVSFLGLELGTYEMVVRYQNEKLVTRVVSLMSRANEKEYFYFDKVDGRFKERERTINMGGLSARWIEEKEITEAPVPEKITEEVPDWAVTDVTTDPTPEDEAEPALKEGNIPASMVVAVFPNPMEGIFFTQINGTRKGATVSLMVFDAKGQVIRKETFEGGEDLYLQVNLSDQAAGIYFVKIIHGSQMIEKRIVKM